MLKSFEVANFKSIKHLEVELRPFMVLVGPNGAGKTNVVQALELLGELLRQGSIEPVRELGYDEIIRREQKPARAGLMLGATFSGSAVDLLGPANPYRAAGDRPWPADDSFELSVRVVVRGSVQDDEIHLHEESLSLRRGNHEIRISLGREPGVVLKLDEDKDLERFARELLRIVRDRESSKSSLEQDIRQRMDAVRTQAGESWLTIPRLLNLRLQQELRVQRIRLDASTLRQDATTKERHAGPMGPAGEGLALALDKLKGHGKESSPAFKALLQQLNTVYPRIEDIEPFRVQPGRLVLRFKERGISEQLGQSSVSDGVLHALALLLALAYRARGSGIVVIEEPENAIHPWPLRQLMMRAQERSRRPLIVTTHSNVVVDTITDPGALFVVEQPDDRGTTVTPARDKEHALDSILRESGMKLGQVWLEGGLGGVPSRE
jgi:predicted ATPase